MNFNRLETLWAEQRPSDAYPRDAAELARRLAPDLRRRSRFFIYEFLCLVIGLVLTPLLAVVNALQRTPAFPVLYWLHVVTFVAVAGLFLAIAIRRLKRHRELTRARANTCITAATSALASIEAEMRDVRAGTRTLAVWAALTLLSIYANNPVTTHGWAPFALRAASALGFYALVGAGFAWHYRKNLSPERARRQAMLADLS